MTEAAHGRRNLKDRVPGADAESPLQIPREGWVQIAKRAWKEGKADSVPLIAAGVAFYAFLAIFPTLIAAILIYGLVADPAQVSQQVDAIGKALPTSAQELLGDQMRSLANTSNSSLSLGLLI